MSTDQTNFALSTMPVAVQKAGRPQTTSGHQNSGEGHGNNADTRPPIVGSSPDTSFPAEPSGTAAPQLAGRSTRMVPAPGQSLFSAVKAAFNRSTFAGWFEDVWAIAFGAAAFYGAIIYVYAVQA